MGRRQFAVHRWLTVVVSVQLFLWSLGGLIFATHDIDWVRGEDGRNPRANAVVDAIYVAANTGRVTARRNNAWRRFDFFWMLHTMDYQGRDDFNHILLIAFAGLGLAAVISG